MDKICNTCGIKMALMLPASAQGAPVWECSKCKKTEVGTPVTKPKEAEAGEPKLIQAQEPQRGVLIQAVKGKEKAFFFFREEDYVEASIDSDISGENVLVQKHKFYMSASNADLVSWLESISD